MALNILKFVLKIIKALTLSFFNFFVALIVAVFPVFLYLKFNTLSIFSFFAYLSFFIFILIIVVNAIVFPKIYDNQFRTIIQDAKNDELNLMNITPLPDSWMIDMRLFRGTFYAGAVFANLTNWKTISFTQMELAKEPEFKKRITIYTKTLACLSVLSFGLFLLTGVLYVLSRII